MLPSGTHGVSATHGVPRGMECLMSGVALMECLMEWRLPEGHFPVLRRGTTQLQTPEKDTLQLMFDKPKNTGAGGVCCPYSFFC